MKIDPVLVHFGMVCGAVDCPKLIREAYTTENVTNEFVANARIFVNDKTKNYLDRQRGILYLSSVFK